MPTFPCRICNTFFKTREELDKHKTEVHDLIYIPFTPEEVGKLYQFFFNGDRSILTPNMIETVNQYNRAVYFRKSAKNKK